MRSLPRWVLAGLLGSLTAVTVINPSAAFATPASPVSPPPSTPPPTAPPSSVDTTGTAPAETSTTIAASGEDIGLGPEVIVAGQQPPLISQPAVRSAPLVVLPPGCPAPPAVTAVFIGEMTARDAQTAQFTVKSVRAGSLDSFAAGDQVQVRYGDDVRFLEKGSTYVVGAAVDPNSAWLVSKVREKAPLFGGDAVLGINDTDVTCPAVEDPVMTLTSAAAPVDSGLLTPLRHAKGALLGALLRPLLIAFMVLIGLVLVKQLAFATARSLRRETTSELPVADVRRRRARLGLRSTGFVRPPPAEAASIAADQGGA